MLSYLDALEHALDHVANWLAEHPRLTCFLICTVCSIPAWMTTIGPFGEY